MVAADERWAAWRARGRTREVVAGRRRDLVVSAVVLALFLLFGSVVGSL